MTKVTVFGKEEAKKEEKKIEFVCNANSRAEKMVSARMRPSEYDNLCLLGEAMSGEDWIMAWDDDSDTKYIYLGHWNDGVV